MPWRPSTSISSTRRPPEASARASAAATVVLPVPPLPVTTCSRTPSQSVSRTLTFRGYPGAGTAGALRPAAFPGGPPGAIPAGAAVSGAPLARVAAEPRKVTRLIAEIGHEAGKEVLTLVTALVVIVVILVLAGLVATGRSLKVVQQYEQGIIFRFGKVLPGTRGPGLHAIRPFGDRMQKVNMQIIAMAVPAQEGITRDNVSVRVDAVVYFRVVDPIKATVNVQNYMFAVSQQAQTSLRSIIGQSEMDQLLAERATVNKELRRVIDEPTEGPWGIRVERVEIKDVSLPEGMKRSMSRQAEAERERRARIITADGEYQASKRLAAAANVMARDPAALQLR